MKQSAINALPKNSVTAYVGIGANLGRKEETIRRAIEDIKKIPNTTLTACSSLYLTEPIEAAGEDYVNAVVRVETRLSAIQVLHALQNLENRFGRIRPAGVVNAPRTLDLDLLLYADAESTEPELILPHPRMLDRAFVLIPLMEIAPVNFQIKEMSLSSRLLSVSAQRVSLLTKETYFCLV